jgi:SAM-dependent methyltransferase
MAEFHNFYQRAFYYDIALGRDVSHEIEFLKAVYRQCHGVNPASLLDLACGPGYHARAFAHQGGRAVGLDLREEMIAFAAEQAAHDGVEVEWLAADMRKVDLTAPVDMAINMFDGIDCLQTNEDLLDHLRSIAANLTPGGLYLIDVTHPRDVAFAYRPGFRYAGQRDGVKVEIVWAVNQPVINPITHVVHTELEVHITDHGYGYTQIIPDSADERILTAQEIILLAQLSGVFEPIGWYGDHRIDQPFDMSERSCRMIAVLQKIV